jgi:predicted acyltransferase
MGMIPVNNPGTWSHVYPPLLHAEWHGCTFTDLIFPFFLFIVGTAMTFSFAKYTEHGDNRRPLIKKIILFLKVWENVLPVEPVAIRSEEYESGRS